MNLQTLSAVVAAALLVTSGVGGVLAADTTTRTDTRGDAAGPGEPVRGDSRDTAPEPFWLADVEGFLAEFEDLTPEERAAILAEVERYRAANASTRDVHHALHYLLYQHGYDTAAVHRVAFEFYLQTAYGLTDAEAEALVAEVVAMREAGERPRDIRATVVERLDAAGADAPDLAHRLAAWFDLTAEQESALRATVVSELRSDNTPRESLRVVADQLREFGVTNAELRAARSKFGRAWADRGGRPGRSPFVGLGPRATGH